MDLPTSSTGNRRLRTISDTSQQPPDRLAGSSGCVATPLAFTRLPCRGRHAATARAAAVVAARGARTVAARRSSGASVGSAWQPFATTDVATPRDGPKVPRWRAAVQDGDDGNAAMRVRKCWRCEWRRKRFRWAWRGGEWGIGMWLAGGDRIFAGGEEFLEAERRK